MATTSKLVLDFEGASENVSFSYNYVNPELTTTKVKQVMTALITNGSIFSNPPLTAKNAKIVTTTENDYDLSD